MSSLIKYRGKWRLKWRDPDGTPRTRTFDLKPHAEAFRREVDADLALGRPWTPRIARALPLLGDAIDAFIADRSRTLSPATLTRYGMELDLFARFIGDETATVAVLSRDTLARYYTWLRIPANSYVGKQRTTNTTRKLVEVVHRAWSWMFDHDELSKHVSPPRRIEMPAVSFAATVAPTWEEMDRCIAHINVRWQQQLAVILRFTGLRANQAMRLVWADFDLDRATMRVRPELGKSTQERTGRTVPISQHLVAILAGWGRREGYVIESTRTGARERVARDRDVALAWARAGVRSEAWAGRPHHAFRKGFVSGLKREGADSDAVEMLIGHSLGLRGVYTDPDAIPMRAAVDCAPPLFTGTATVLSLANHKAHA